MQGRYNGAHMSVFGYILPGSKRLSRIKELDKVALYRLAIVEFYLRNNKQGRLTAKTFNVSTATVYRWVNRYKRWNLITLRDYSHRPHHTRTPMVNWKIVEEVVKLRKDYPARSKYKLNIELKKLGYTVSDSTVGRILTRKHLVKPRPFRKSKPHISCFRPHTSKDLWNRKPGALIQIDTAYLNPAGRGFCFQYIATDTFTRLSFAKVYPTRGSKNGKLFLEELNKQFPFKIEAIQSDNGSEFLGEFHKSVQELGITHYFTHPATPKMNSRVERMIRTTRDELWNQGYLLGDLSDLNESLSAYINEYNNQRPHQSLKYLTPMKYYQTIEEASRFR
jgi:transposase InsO family protein